MSLNLKTDFADIQAEGEFLPDDDITARVTLDGDVSDLTALMALIPNDVEIGSAVSSVKIAGDYTYENGVLSAKGANLSALGSALEASFKGDAVIKETPSFSGRVDAQSADVQALLRALPSNILPADIKGLELLNTANISANLGNKGEGFEASDIDTLISGDGFSASYKGAADIGEAIAAQGAFTVQADSVSNIFSALNIDAPQANAVGSVVANGTVSFANEILTLAQTEIQAEGGAVQGKYSGSAVIGESVSFEGLFEGAVPSLSEFAALSGTEIPYSTSIGRVNISTDVKGQASQSAQNIELSSVDAALSEGQINGRYRGGVTLKDGLKLAGALEVEIPSLREIAKANGTELPPNTQAGDIFGPLSITGQVSGTPETVRFEEAKLSLDRVSGLGVFAVDLTPAKPFVTGDLVMEGLDLRPYMAAYSAQNPTGEIQPWSQEPINAAFLKSIDGDFTLSTPNIILERLSVDESKASAKIRAGVLTADVPNLALYGGLGRMTATLNAAGSMPSVSLEAGLDDLNSNKFLAAIAGFTNATGEGGTVLKIAGQGRSQADIMASLNGSGDFKLVNGQVSGVDLGELLTGLDQALTSRSLPGGIGANYQTKFKDIIGLFTIENGVVKIGKFSLSGLNVLAEGQGEIDLGAQNIDFSLRPRLTGEAASNIAAFGVPVRFKGGFGNVSAGLDTDMLGKIAAQRAKAEAQSLVKEKIGGQVGGAAGDLLGVVLGGETPAGGDVPDGSSADKPSETEVVTDLLGGLLGKTPAEETPAGDAGTASPETPKTEKAPSLEDALGGLFGKSKKEKESGTEE